MGPSIKHTIVTALSAIFGTYIATKVPGVNPEVAVAMFAGLLAHLLHVQVQKSEVEGDI